MPHQKSVLQSLLKISSVIFVLLVGVFNIVSISTNASVNIIPKTSDPKNQNDKGWILHTLKPGGSAEDAVVLSNPSNEDITVEVKGRDVEITQEGSYTVISNKLENQQAGKWIVFDSETYAIPAAKSITVPFKIQIPTDAKSGEYGAGIAVLQLGDKNGDKSGNVTIKTRSASRVFITVEGDLKLDGKAEKLNIIDPKDENFLLETKKRSSLGKDNLIFQFLAQNTGNVYATLEGSYTVDFPDGEKFTGTLKQDIATNTPIKEFYIETKKPYKAGTTKVTLDYVIVPLNIKSLLSNAPKSTLTDSLTLTQEEVDKFAPARSKLIITKDDSKSGGKISEPVKALVEKSKPNKISEYLVYIIIGLLFVIVLLLGLNLKKKKHQE
jgi:hypothetical protein